MNGPKKCLCNEKSIFMTPLGTSRRAESHGTVGFFYYGKGKYCNPRSNINILIPKMSGAWDRIRSLVTSHVRVNLAFLIVFVVVFLFLIVYDSNVWRHRGNLTAWWGGQNLCHFYIKYKVFSLAVIKKPTAPWDSAHQEVPSWVIKNRVEFFVA